MPIKIVYLPSLPHNGSETSRAAAESMVQQATAARVRILARLVQIEPLGSTSDAMQRFLGLRHQTNSPRFVELADDGLIEDTGDQLPTISGRMAIVWRPTNLGIQAVTEGWYKGHRIVEGPRESRISIMRGALAEALRGWKANTTAPDELARIAELEELTKASPRRKG